MQINNFMELHTAIDMVVQQALDLTTEELLDKLEEYIQTEVYDIHSLWESAGLRTGQFKDSWERSNAVIVTRGIVSSQIFQNVSVMKQSNVPPIHIDRDDLAQIINSGVGYNFGTMEGTARPYWDKFLDWVNMNVERIFAEKCKQVGLPIGASIYI